MLTNIEYEEDAAIRLIREATRAYSTRRVPREAMTCLLPNCPPEVGDLVLARVEAIGYHKRLHRPDRSKRNLFVGDLVIVAYADRYAPSQFEAIVPSDLRTCHLAAAGGIASRVVLRHDRIRRAPTVLRPLGLLASGPEAPPLNVAGWALDPPRSHDEHNGIGIPVVAIVGTSMDSGKTTVAAHLARGLKNSGLRVGYAKVTGTAAAGDPSLVLDAGADPVLDFTDAGFASTYRLARGTVEAIFRDLVGHVAGAPVDGVLIEVADGLFQTETASLLESGSFRTLVDQILFAAPESMGATAGAAWLRERRLPLVALSGVLASSPLQVREAREQTGLPVYGPQDLLDPSTAAKLLVRRSVATGLEK
ncbi:MAG TPA: DUF1611 domain-containing protein [Deltaproteobacteria bacterium]|nr:DUF1611 domain-containing protein [Deltaproteobacteria bacterium]